MSKLSTFNYLINSFYSGKKEVEVLQFSGFASSGFAKNADQFEFEPSQSCISAILNYALQFDVLKSGTTGLIELNLN